EGAGLSRTGRALHEVTMVRRETCGDGVFLRLLPGSGCRIENRKCVAVDLVVKTWIDLSGEERKDTLLTYRRGLDPTERVEVEPLQIQEILVENPVIESQHFKRRNGK